MNRIAFCVAFAVQRPKLESNFRCSSFDDVFVCAKMCLFVFCLLCENKLNLIESQTKATEK